MNLYNQSSTNQTNSIYLSQPTTCFNTSINGYTTSHGINSSSSIEMIISDTNNDCECIVHGHGIATGEQLANAAHIQSFSQPISTDNMLLNSQV